MTFRIDNTDGFTAQQLDELNAALEALVAEGWDEKAASDRLNNEWGPGVETADALLSAVRSRRAS